MNILKNFLICLTGLPASGKSSFSKVLKQQLSETFKDRKIIIIDPDLIRKSLTNNEFDPTKEKIVREKNLGRISNSLEKGNIVISDDLNYYTSMRHDLKKIADFFNIPFFIVYVATPLEICLIWNKKRGKTIPDEIIGKIYDKFDHFDNYLWESPIYEFDPSKLNDLRKHANEISSKILSKLNKSNLPNLKKLEEEINSNILIERFEKITRQTVGKLLKNSRNNYLKDKILELRKVFVKKNRNIPLSESEISNNLILFLEETLNTKLT